MRKASQDGGDNTSITSGTESETRKPGASILKSTRNSIKRKVQNFNIESDDMANEPLLQKNKEKTEIEKQSAKFLIAKTKTDFVSEKGDDRDKLLADDKIEKPSISDVAGITMHGATIGDGLKEQKVFNSQTSYIHNHMNTNIFNDSERPSDSITPKAKVLVELDVSKPLGPKYSPSSLIFTTAKIHTDGKNQHMEPVQVTPVPILSTTEGGVVKSETFAENGRTTGEKVTKNSDKMDITTNGGANLPKLGEKKDVAVKQNVSLVLSNEKAQCANNIITVKNNVKDTNILQTFESDSSHSTTANKPIKCELNSKNLKESPELKDVIENKLTGSTLKTNDIPRVSKTVPNSCGMNESKQGLSFQGSPSFGKNHVDINKNIQSPSSSKPFKNVSNNKEKYSEASQSFVLSTKDKRDNNTRTKSHGMRNEKESSKDITSSNLSEKSPATSVPDALKSGLIDKVPLAKSPKVAQSTSAVITPLSNLSNVTTVSTLANIENPTSIVTSTISITPSSAVTISTTTKRKGVIDNTSTTPTCSDLKKSVDQSKWLESDLKSVSNIQASVKNTGDNASKSPLSGTLDSKSSSIGTPKNTATVVSSITKPTSTASSTKTPDAGSSTGMIRVKVPSSTKQSATSSTVRTIFSTNQAMKSPIVKSNLRITSNEVDKSKPTVKRNTSPSASGATERSAAGAPILSSTKPTVTSSLIKAQKNTNDKASKINESVKDSKGLNADK